MLKVLIVVLAACSDLHAAGRFTQGLAILADGDVTTDKIGAGAVTTPKLAQHAVTEYAILPYSVTTAKIGGAAVTTGKLETAAVTTTKIDDGAVTTNKLLSDAVTTSKILDDSVTTSKLIAYAVTTGKLNDGAVTTSKLLSYVVTTDKISDGSITTAKLLSHAITTSKLAEDAIAALSILSGAVTTAKLDAGAITTDKIASGAVTTAKMLSHVITTDKLNDNAVTTAKLADASVTTGRIADGSVTTNKLLDGTVTTNKLDTSGDYFVRSLQRSGAAILVGGSNGLALDNNAYLIWRNAANSANLSVMRVDAADKFNAVTNNNTWELQDGSDNWIFRAYADETSAFRLATTHESSVTIRTGSNIGFHVREASDDAVLVDLGRVASGVGYMDLRSGGAVAIRMQANADSYVNPTSGQFGVGLTAPVYTFEVSKQMGITGTDPTLSSCGTTPSVVGTDSAGKVTIGTGATTSCTVTFTAAFAAAPACVVTGDNTAVTYQGTTTTTALTIISSADMASDVVSYICIGL